MCMKIPFGIMTIVASMLDYHNGVQFGSIGICEIARRRR